MLRITLSVVFAVSCFAQNAEEIFNKPPADVDQALRARITEFYGYAITNEPRKGEALVAEDTKDFYYNNNKPHFTHCEIRAIKYSDNFTKAAVTMFCGMKVFMLGFQDKVFDVPFASNWKIENGKWMWYVSEEQRRASPMGPMTPGPPVTTAQSDPSTHALPAIPGSADFLYSMVKIEKGNVELKRGESAQLSISNTSPGVVYLQIEGKVQGVEATLDNSNPKQNEKAVLSLKAGDDAQSGTLQIVVNPIRQTIPIHLTVK